MGEMCDEIAEAARRVYRTLGPGHEETIYREAMSIELQEMGYMVKTEMPVEIKYRTTRGKEIIVGTAKIDLYIEKEGEKSVIELKSVAPLIKERGGKTREEMKEYAQLQKYLRALGERKGFIINFPFPPRREPEIIASETE